MHQLDIIEAGNTNAAAKAVVFIHGRGATAESILSLSEYFPFKDFYFVAPQATNHTWYPYSFMAPREQNEPWLSSALEQVEAVVSQLNLKGFKNDQIYFVGFSQGACLLLEYIATHPDRYAGAFAYIGGLIGDVLDLDRYNGNLLETTIYIGTSDPDMHVPILRVHETAEILQKMNAAIKVDYFKQLGHTISTEGIENGVKHIIK